jgi:hypothetical protein
MNALVRVKLEMAARVRDFLHNHPLADAGFTAAMASFDALMARATGHSTLQQEGVVTARNSTTRRKEVKDLLRNGLLRHVAGVGQVAAKERPELAGVFQLPSMNTHLSFITSAGRMLAEAEANKDFLATKGLGDTTIDDLKKALAELDTVDGSSRSARANHVGARADLEAVTKEIMDQVRLLDGTVRYRFRDDPEILAAWKSARNVPPRPHAKAVTPETPATPATPVTPAAGQAAA